MKAIYIPVAGKVQTITLNDNKVLEELQRAVGGYIEPCAPYDFRIRGIELLADEEGALKCLPFNDHFYPFFLLGDLVAVGVDEDDFVNLTDNQIEYVYKWLEALRREYDRF